MPQVKCAESILNKYAEPKWKIPTHSLERIRKVGSSGEDKGQQQKGCYGVDMNLGKLKCWRLVSTSQVAVAGTTK